MAHIWTEDPETGRWSYCPLDDAVCLIEEGGLRRPEAADRGLCGPAAAMLIRSGRDAGEQWSLLAVGEEEVLVNGRPLPLRMKTLRDRDEVGIRFGVGERLCRRFFSTERLARVEPFPAGAAAVPCPRCKQRLRPGQPAVRCPRCGAWHHQTEQLPCWTYSPTCACLPCDQSTSLEVGFRWTPEDL